MAHKRIGHPATLSKRPGSWGVFFDLTEEAEGLDAFRAAARSFFEASDAASVSEWIEAREAVRAGSNLRLDHGLHLRKETGEPDAGFAVVEVRPDQIAPELNHFVPNQPNLLAA